MTVTEQDALRRLKSPKNLINSLGPITSNQSVEHVPIPHPHRTAEVPDFLRITAGVLAHGSKIKEVSEGLGLDPQVVQQAKNGKVGGREDAELKGKVDRQLTRVREIAIEKLLGSLGLLTDDKMKGCNAKDLSGVASNMSKVIGNLTPQERNGPTAQILIYSPQTREENRFKVVEV